VWVEVDGADSSLRPAEGYGISYVDLSGLRYQSVAYMYFRPIHS
jgi:hypothetical protein